MLYTSATGRVARRDSTARQQEAAIALAVIERDLNCAVHVRGCATQQVFSLTPGSSADLEKFNLKYFTVSPHGNTGLLSLYDIFEVEYMLQRDTAGFYRLVRSARPVRPDGKPEELFTETLCRDVGDFIVQVSDSVSWTNKWRATAGDSLPSAASVKLFFAGQNDPFETWTLVPAGIDLKKTR